MDHYHQIRRYIENAPKSGLLKSLLEKGSSIRGVLATVEECRFDVSDSNVSVCIVDRKRTIEILKGLREHRWNDIQL